MRSTTTTTSSEQACSRRGWQVPDVYNIVHAFAYSYITGRVRALNDSQKI
ncbi:MAG: hypothetical protein ACLP0J_05430 [Solirubrobacteraceae bacterium]|jgi:hypothetical protein